MTERPECSKLLVHPGAYQWRGQYSGSWRGLSGSVPVFSDKNHY